MTDLARLLSEKASTIYDGLTFNSDQLLYNEPAPEPFVSFIIGGVFSVVMWTLWVLRVRRMRQELGITQLKGSLAVRLMLSAYIDNDDAFFTMTKMAGHSFLFLGGLQLNFRATFVAMLGYFALESCFDSARVILAFREAKGFDDLVVTSSSIRQKMRTRSTTLQPTNVYEDLSREKTIVIMVFITQCLLIAFVVADIYDNETHTCTDGTSGCPVVGTLGSWSFYILGIFMANVYLLGPKTAFGQSEQNPAYWLQLLLFAKQTGTQCTWYDPVKDQACARHLKLGDYRIWIRFIMSFLINGVGFHILVHALPIQVAGQSSLTGVVFRAVGMMYLVDLDDTPGFKLTLVEQKEDPAVKKVEVAGAVDGVEVVTTPVVVNEGEIATLAQQIIDDARAQLDALANGEGLATKKKKFSGALALAADVRDVDDGANDDGGGDEEGGEDGCDGGGDGGGMDS